MTGMETMPDTVPGSRSVRSPADAARLFPAEALSGPGERMLLAPLDAAGAVLSLEWIAAGDGGSLVYDAGLVARRLAESGAAWFLLVHNHPGGDPSLSETDAAGVRATLLRPPPLLFRFLDFLNFLKVLDRLCFLDFFRFQVVKKAFFKNVRFFRMFAHFPSNDFS